MKTPNLHECAMCNQAFPAKELTPLQTKANGKIEVCPKCEAWVRRNGYARGD